MFNRNEINEFGCYPLNIDVYNAYSSCSEIYYLFDYIKKKINIQINSRLNLHSWLLDNVYVSEMLDEDTNNYIYFAKIYKKTTVHYENSGYTKITIFDKGVIYYNYEKNNLLLTLYKSDIGYVTFNYIKYIPDFLYLMFDVEDWETVTEDVEYKKFVKIYNNYSNPDSTINTIEEMKAWLIRNCKASVENNKSAIKEFFKGQYKQRKDNLEDNIKIAMKDMEYFLNIYRDKYDILQKLNIELSVLETQINNAGDEGLVDIFNAYGDKCELLSVNNNNLTFICRNYLTTFDADLAENVADNKYYCLYNLINCQFSGEQLKKLFNAIFTEDAKYKIYINQKFTLTPNGNICPLNDNGNEALQNPHLAYYRCFGANGNYITEAFKKGEFEQGIMLTYGCTAAINLNESVTVKRLFDDMFIAKRRCKYIMNNETGEMLTPYEVLEELDGKREVPAPVVEEVKTVDEQINDALDDLIDGVEPEEEDIEPEVQPEDTRPVISDEDIARIGINWTETNINTNALIFHLDNGFVVQNNRLITTEPIEEEEFVPTFNHADRNAARVGTEER